MTDDPLLTASGPPSARDATIEGFGPSTPDGPTALDHAPVAAMLEESGGQLRLTVRTRGPLPRAGWIRTEPDHEEALTPLRPAPAPDGRGWTSWVGVVPTATHEAVTRYAFKFVWDDQQAWLTAAGREPGDADPVGHFRHVVGYEPAAWVWDQVVYQVFPDRFRRSGVGGGPPEAAAPVGHAHFGGDLDGVREGLGHLADLGASTLYLNPVFASPSSHRYDTTDYDRVDPGLGGEPALARLVTALRGRGMRIVLDAVVNHTSDRHPWFDRLGTANPPGAYRDPASPYRGRYVFRDPSDPDSFVGWKGSRSLPVLDYADAGLREAMYAGPDAVLRRWLRAPWGIDGWRLDVVHMIGEGAGALGNADLVRAMRRAIREERGDAFVLGEHFHDATAWLQGDQEDGAMNYTGFLRPVLAFWAGVDLVGDPERCDAADLEGRLTRVRARLPWPIALSQLNFLSTHDVPRFLTRLEGDVAGFVAAHHQLLGYVGVPSIYYGDEVGLEGGADPDNRRPFPWDPSAWRPEIHRPIRRLAHLRRRHPALVRGRYRPLVGAGDVHAFARVDGGDAVIVVAHRGGGGRCELPVGTLGVAGPWWDALDGRRLVDDGETLHVEVERRGARTLVNDPAHLATLPPLD